MPSELPYEPFIHTAEVNGADLDDINSPYNVEELAYMVANERAKLLQDKTNVYLTELKQRLANVRALTDYLALINSVTDADGKIDLLKDPDYKQKLDAIVAQLQEAPVTLPQDNNADPVPTGKLCFDIPKDNNGQYRTLFSKEERERLVEVVQSKSKNFTFDNHMQMQEIARLTSEKTEIYQYFRMALKPIHEAKVICLRGMVTHK